MKRCKLEEGVAEGAAIVEIRQVKEEEATGSMETRDANDEDRNAAQPTTAAHVHTEATVIVQVKRARRA